MIRVRTNTGADLVVGEHTFSPTTATTVEAMTPEMEFYKDLLQLEEVDENGRPVEASAPEPPPPTVSGEEHAKVVAQRDDSDLKLISMSIEKHELERDLAVMRASRETAERSVATLTSERDGLRTELNETGALLERNEAELTAAAERATKIDAEHKRAIADLKTKHEGETKAAAEKAKAAHDELVAKHKAEIERLKAK